MANSQLQGKTYLVPTEILNSIEAAKVNYPNSEGIKRAKNILNEPNLSYDWMRRLKNYFDKANPQTDGIRYALAGGDAMRKFVETSLTQDTAAVQRSKENRRAVTNDLDSDLKPFQTPRLTLQEEKKEKEKNAVAIIVNVDNKILLLKRVDDPKIWQPNKWALVGGGIEKGETPQKAVEREIEEETGLEIKKFIKSFTIERNSNSIEHMFVCRYDGEPTDIELDTKENTNYGWYGIDEMNYLDVVPNLVDYISLAFKKYD